MKKKMFFVVTAALIAILIGFTSCSQSASSVLSGGKEDTPSVPPGTGGGIHILPFLKRTFTAHTGEICKLAT